MNKIPCIKCGAMILQDTAQRTEGLCMPCKRATLLPARSEEDDRKFQESFAPARAFAELWKKEKQELTEAFVGSALNRPTLVSVLIERMGLTAYQRLQITEVIDHVLTDTMYTLLLGLDGCANIGGRQETYKIYREDGALVSNCGELEVAAYEAFHGETPGGVLGSKRSPYGGRMP